MMVVCSQAVFPTGRSPDTSQPNRRARSRQNLISMADTSVDLAFFDNETLERTFTLRSGTADSSVPINLTGVTFEADVRDQRGALVLHLSTDADGGIVVSDPENGIVVITIPQGTIAFVANRSLRYDLLMLASGTSKRLFGGVIRVSAGVTVPE